LFLQLWLTARVSAPEISQTEGEIERQVLFYDFIAHASEAKWYSMATGPIVLGGYLPFPGSDTDERGFALYRDKYVLEDGSTWERVLETHPEWVSNGWISGEYPQLTVPENAAFQVTTGFLSGATGTDGVTFEVWFFDLQGETKRILSYTNTYDNQLQGAGRTLVDLAGRTGSFVLKVLAGETSNRDWAVWAEAKINTRVVSRFALDMTPYPQVTIDVGPLRQGTQAQVGASITVTVSLVTGVPETFALDISSSPTWLRKAPCVPSEEEPPFTSQCVFAVSDVDIPSDGVYGSVISATSIVPGITLQRYFEIRVVSVLIPQPVGISSDPPSTFVASGIYKLPSLGGGGTVAAAGQPYQVTFYVTNYGLSPPEAHWLRWKITLPTGGSSRWGTSETDEQTVTLYGLPWDAGTYYFRVSVTEHYLDWPEATTSASFVLEVVPASHSLPPTPESIDYQMLVTVVTFSVELSYTTTGAVEAAISRTMLGAWKPPPALNLWKLGGDSDGIRLEQTGLPDSVTLNVGGYVVTGETQVIAEGLWLGSPGEDELTFELSVAGPWEELAGNTYRVNLRVVSTSGVEAHMVAGYRYFDIIVGALPPSPFTDDFEIISAEAVQVLFGAPLVEGKGTAFRVKVHSTFADQRSTYFLLRLREEYWDTSLPESVRKSVRRSYASPPSGWKYPEIWGPVLLNYGDNEIMLPIVPAGRENEDFDYETDPAGMVRGTCQAGACAPDFRYLPRPILPYGAYPSFDIHFAVAVDPAGAPTQVIETNEYNNAILGTAYVYRTKRLQVYFTLKLTDHSEDALMYCPKSDIVCPDPDPTGCCGGGATCCVVGPDFPNCSGASKTMNDVCQETEDFAKASLEYLLGVMPVADLKAYYTVDCAVKYRGNQNVDDFASDMVVNAMETGMDYALIVQPWGGCGFTAWSNAASIELYTEPPTAAHELAGHAIQGIGECYSCGTSGSPIDCGTCGATEGFWANKWRYYPSGRWPSSGSYPSYYMDFVGPIERRWTRLEQPCAWVDGAPLNGGYRQLVNLLLSEEDPNVLLVSGIVHKDGSVKLRPFKILENATVDIGGGRQGDYYVVLLDSESRVLSTAAFNASFQMFTPEGRVETDTSPFVYRVRWDEATKTIEVQDKSGAVLASRQVSPNKPEVELLYPNGGEVWQKGQNYTIQWRASDKDGDALTYSLAISTDGGGAWLPVGTGITEDKYELSTAMLDDGENCLLRVRATDGVNTAQDVSDAKFSIVPAQEVTTQVTSETSAATSTQPPGPKCLVATATYGSELSPEVQFLRNFRDNSILKTKTGSSFMLAFNAWYYSFSPTVAQSIAEHPGLRTATKFTLYPLMGILRIGAEAFHLFPANLEASAILSGLLVSSLIGAVYFGPPLAPALACSSKGRRAARRLQVPVAVVFFGALAAVAFLTAIDGAVILMALTTSTLVLASLVASAFTASRAILRLMKRA